MDIFKSKTNATAGLWLAVGLLGSLLLPWYGIEDGFFSFEWMVSDYLFDTDYAPLFWLLVMGEKSWLAPLILPFLISGLAVLMPDGSRLKTHLFLIGGGLGLFWLMAQGLAIGIRGWQFNGLADLFGPLSDRQFGMGYGAIFYYLSSLFLFSIGVAERRGAYGDKFVISMIIFVVLLVTIFIFYPICKLFLMGFIDEQNSYSLFIFIEKFTDKRIWSLGCLIGGGRCGVALNSLFMAIIVGALTTILGLVFALLVTRTNLKFRRVIRAMSVLPIITPPFVIGLAIILLFGLSGIVTTFVADVLGVAPTRWIYGLPGIVLAQTLAYTPIAFLVLIGVVESISPSLEEAGQTLRAKPLQVFETISLPLMRPGLANAFLLGFIESMVDFGNPLVLGGNYDVLSTEIFFAIVGAQYDQGKAAVLAIVLLSFTLLAFYIQRFWLGKKSYTTITGKGDSGLPMQLPKLLSVPIIVTGLSWGAFTLLIYSIIIYGSFVKTWGLDYSLSFKHYISLFSFSFAEDGIQWIGSAWNSFWTTFTIALIAAPLTAAMGLVIAYLLSRHNFAAKSAFEFGTMLSFAIPGTVIGVSYILAFNVPPIEITGTGIILVVSFIFRNMPVGLRSGVAAMSQLDKSLDESSLTLGANSFQTFTRIILPLLRPAILAALVFSFVRSMTAISAVIFLVSAEYDMATSYIIGRVENNDYGLAIAYSTTLIVLMLAVIVLMQIVVGKAVTHRRAEKITA
ncbi:MAG: ABC transporter permease subunit [Alphaproteobacteria bacterium]|nr:ABC transporter permease subunit [Alphaproteobacteria bacterium]